MVTKTFQTAVTNTDYTKVGDDVTSIRIAETRVGWMRVVVTDVGDATPAVDTVDYAPFNLGYSHNGDAVDVWIRTEEGAGVIHGQI